MRLGQLKPVSALRDQTARNSSFLPVLSPISLCEGLLDLLTPPSQFISSFPKVALSPLLSLMALAVLLQCSGVALSSFVVFTAVWVEMFLGKEQVSILHFAWCRAQSIRAC